MVKYYIVLLFFSYVVIGVSFFLPYSCTRFFNLAHAIVFTCGAYFFYLFAHSERLSLAVSLIIACFLCAIMNLLFEVLFFRPIRHRTVGNLAPLLASLGLYVVIQNSISMFFGDDAKLMHTPLDGQMLLVAGIPLTGVDFLIIACGLLTLVGAWILFSFANLGRAMQCVAQDKALAEAVGIRTTRVLNWSFFLGGALCGLAGALAGIDTALVPTMGLNAMMMSSIAVILGQRKGVWGVAAAAFLLAFAQRGGAYIFGAQWQDTAALVAMISCILLLEWPKARWKTGQVS